MSSKFLINNSSPAGIFVGEASKVSAIYVNKTLVWSAFPISFIENNWAGVEKYSGAFANYDEGAIYVGGSPSAAFSGIKDNYPYADSRNTMVSVSVVTRNPVEIPGNATYLCVKAVRTSAWSPVIRIGFARDGETDFNTATNGLISAYNSSIAVVPNQGDTGIFYFEIPEEIKNTALYKICLISAAQVNNESSWSFREVYISDEIPENGKLLIS